MTTIFRKISCWTGKKNEISAYEKLKNLIGLKIVKEQIDNIIAADIVEKERKKRNGNDYQSSAMHMIFGGNPGSAKNYSCKIIFRNYKKEKGILKSGAFVERGGMDLGWNGMRKCYQRSISGSKRRRSVYR